MGLLSGRDQAGKFTFNYGLRMSAVQNFMSEVLPPPPPEGESNLARMTLALSRSISPAGGG